MTDDGEAAGSSGDESRGSMQELDTAGPDAGKKLLGLETPVGAVSGQGVDFSGRWRNELGSTMEIKVFGNEVRGIYRTAVGEPTKIEEFDLVGRTNGDLISWIVSWGKYGSMTAWTGQHSYSKEGEEGIWTMWHLAKNIDDPSEPKRLWGSVITGANLFRRTE